MEITRIRLSRDLSTEFTTYTFVSEVHGHRGQEYTCHFRNVYGFYQVSKYKNLGAFVAAQKRVIKRGGIKE